MKIIYLYTAVNWYRVALFRNISKMVDLHVFILNGYKLSYKEIQYEPDFDGINITFLSENDSIFSNLVSILDKESFDSIVIPSMNGIDYLKLSSKLAKYYWKNKTVLYFWEYWPLESMRATYMTRVKQMVRTVLFKLTRRYIDYYIVPSIYNLSYYLRNNIPSNKIVRCFNASEMDVIYSEEIRNKLNVRIDEKIILYLGRLEAYKGILELIDVFQKINNSKWHLVVCGPGQLADECTKRVTNKNIHLMGSVNPSERYKYYSCANLFVLPNTYLGKIEAWGLTINEAMAYGLPILASNGTGGAMDLVMPGVNGYLLNADTLKSDLERYINLILNDEELEQKMGENSRNIVKNYTFYNMATAFVVAAEKGNKYTV